LQDFAEWQRNADGQPGSAVVLENVRSGVERVLLLPAEPHFFLEATVRKIFASVITLCLIVVAAFARPSAQQTVRPAAAAAPTVDDVLRAVRADVQTSRADVLAKNMTLSAEQAAKFWPVFEQYQKEQNVIMDEQMKGIQQYVDNAENLDDAGALALMKAHLDRDAKMNALRQQWLGEFQKVLPTKLAARAMQIDRRLSLVHQIEFAARIPLVH
jgi:Spy/CpxP family protein refolding chaperone